MKKLLLLITVLGSFSLFAQSKADIKKMLEHMKKTGAFSAEQVKAAQEQLDKLSDEDLNKIKAKAKSKMNDPKIQKKLKSITKDL